jgi:hypothetical protein
MNRSVSTGTHGQAVSALSPDVIRARLALVCLGINVQNRLGSGANRRSRLAARNTGRFGADVAHGKRSRGVLRRDLVLRATTPPSVAP